MTPRWPCWWLALLLLSFGAHADTPLTLARALSLNGPADLEPSGLAVCGGELLMVSDNHRDRVFRLVLEADQARVEVARRLPALPAPDLSGYGVGPPWLQRLAGRWDWEGLACEGSTLYLLSEALAQVLRLEADDRATWMGSAAYRAGRGIGLFEQHNAFAEGLALDAEHAYIAAERQPRGLVVNRREGGAWPNARAIWLNPFPDLTRPHDFSGLWAEKGVLYTLERNHYRVCRREGPAFAETRCWNYRHVELDPAHTYRDQRFGKTEGIARRGDLLYLVLDNNGGARVSAPDDTRPWLFEFALPPAW